MSRVGLLHLLRWSGSRDPLGSAFTGAVAEVLSGRSWLVPVLLSISASPSSLSVCDALLCACSATGQQDACGAAHALHDFHPLNPHILRQSCFIGTWPVLMLLFSPASAMAHAADASDAPDALNECNSDAGQCSASTQGSTVIASGGHHDMASACSAGAQQVGAPPTLSAGGRRRWRA